MATTVPGLTPDRRLRILRSRAARGISPRAPARPACPIRATVREPAGIEAWRRAPEHGVNARQDTEGSRMNKVDIVEQARLRDDIPEFWPGDNVKVNVRVVEGTRSRIQAFEGVVIARKGGGLRETFTVRKISFGVGVERTFPLHSPVIESIEVTRHGKVRRAKLYYLRDRVGKAARIKEKRNLAG